MDAATQSGLGAGMTAGARPNMSQIMGMMSGQSSVAHTLELRLRRGPGRPARPLRSTFRRPAWRWARACRCSRPASAPPVKTTPGLPPGYERPKGRMLIYWGCGEHVGAGQPTVIDFSKLAAGQVPPGMAAMANAARAATRPGRRQRAGLWRMAQFAGLARGAGQWLARRRPPGRGQLFAADRLHA